jgi:hypothetical protein
MFETHKGLELEIRNFLNRFADQKGWLPLKTQLQPNRDFVSIQGNYLIFEARNTHLTSHASIMLALTPHNRVVTYLVSRFCINPHELLNLPEEQAVFTFHGKRLADRSDRQSPLHGNLWEISCPANLVALFKEYDKLAAWNDGPTIFNIP